MSKFIMSKQKLRKPKFAVEPHWDYIFLLKVSLQESIPAKESKV